MDSENRTAHAKHFDRVHAAQVQSLVLRDIWRGAYGDEYPAEVNPSAFFPRSTLMRLVAELDLGPGRTVVDLGCGHGGAALWLAKEYGSDVIGIDLSAAGVAAGNRGAAELALGERARFIEGDITDTRQDEASCDAAISLNVLCFVPDKPAAIAEAARILKPGGRLALTTWEQEGYSERLKAEQMTDHRPAFETAGFEVESYDEPDDWREQQRAALEGLIKFAPDLEAEFDAGVADHFSRLAEGMLRDMPKRRYVAILARRR